MVDGDDIVERNRQGVRSMRQREKADRRLSLIGVERLALMDRADHYLAAILGPWQNGKGICLPAQEIDFTTQNWLTRVRGRDSQCVGARVDVAVGCAVA